MMEAVTELDAPRLAVFEAPTVPVSSKANLPSAVIDALDKSLAEQPKGQKYYFNTGAVGDSASAFPHATLLREALTMSFSRAYT